jgi:release factor glutamine methyltransferase
MTLYDLLTEGSAALLQAGDTDGENDAKLLLFEVFHLDLVHFLMDRLRPLSESDAETQEKMQTYRGMIAKRASRIPLQQILGSQEFMGLEFYVNEHVLIPRQDTETLVELVLQEQQGREKKLLDLCTGSGCIAISLAVKGGYESVTATDLSEEALKVAERNAKTHQKKIIFRQGDLFSALPQTEAGTFDIITSNPPYIPTAVIATLEPEVREHEPMMALDGTEDGLRFYRQIAQEAGTWLKPGGAIYLEIGYDQGEAVSGLLREAGFDKVRVVKDLPGKDRVVCGVWPG